MTNKTNTISPLAGSLFISFMFLVLQAPAWAQTPTLTGLSPNAAPAGAPAFTLTVNGTNFTADSIVVWNGSSRTTTFVSSTKVTASIPASDVAVLGSAQVTVVNGPGGPVSNALTFTITTRVPAIVSLIPSSKQAGSPGFILTVNGMNFLTTSTVQWNASARPTSFFSDGVLEAAISASDIALAGTADVTVVNTPGTEISNTAVFDILTNAPPPAISSINPSLVVARGPAFSLTVTGSNFTPTSMVRLNGSNRSTTFIDTTKLSAAISATDIAQPGTAAITVVETAPGGGTSNAVILTIEAFSTLYFSHVAVGGGYTTSFTLTNTGAVAASGNLLITDQSGAPLPVTLTEGANPVGTGATLPIAVLPGGTRIFTANPLSPTDPLKAGWARVETSTGTLSGVATFRLSSGGVLRTIAGVVGTRPTEFVTIPIDNDAGQQRFTGFAIANQNAEPINVRIVTLNSDGAVLDAIRPTELNPLGPQKQIARFLHEYLASRENFRGSLVLIADGARKFVVTALVQDQGLLTVIPVIPDKPANVN